MTNNVDSSTCALLCVHVASFVSFAAATARCRERIHTACCVPSLNCCCDMNSKQLLVPCASLLFLLVPYHYFINPRCLPARGPQPRPAHIVRTVLGCRIAEVMAIERNRIRMITATASQPFFVYGETAVVFVGLGLHVWRLAVSISPPPVASTCRPTPVGSWCVVVVVRIRPVIQAPR